MSERLFLEGKGMSLEEAFLLGSRHFREGRLGEAEAVYQGILRHDADQPRALHALGVVSHRQGRSEVGVGLVRRALELDPDFADAHNNLGNMLKELGQLAEAVKSYRKAVQARPGFAAARSNLLLTMHYLPECPPEAIFRESLSFGKMLAADAESVMPVPLRDPDPHRRLRVGYLSPDFREHSVSYFVTPLFRAHDRSRLELFCYADLAAGDGTTERLRDLSDRWRQVGGMSDGELVETVRKDGIDILVDLAGHTGRNRLSVFAAKAAPIQVTWLGYPDTTGLAAIDYRLTDPIADPQDSDARYTEQLVRLRPVFLCYAPPPAAPDCARLPAIENGFVTFGSFNHLAKLTPQVLELWSELLRLVPGSRLLLKNASLCHEPARRHCLTYLGRGGVDVDRIEFLPFAGSTAEHLALYHRLDISLDPFPYNGTTTTCESLWMGVPAVTLAGSMHAGRVGATLLAAVGLESLIARTPVCYLEAACGLAADVTGLARLRSGLRERIAASPLCDGVAFARQVEQAYREMWLRLVKG